MIEMHEDSAALSARREADEPAATAGARGWLESIRADGAHRFDPAAFAFVERLVGKAEALGGVAGARLAERASARAELLARELERAKGRAREALADYPGAARLLAAADAGNVAPALRFMKKRAAMPARRRDHGAWVERLSAEASARGVSLGTRARNARTISGALYDASRGAIGALHAAIQAEAAIPPGAGPYNSLAISARALAEMAEVAPAYLGALLSYLQELAPLLELPPPPPPEEDRPSPPARRRPRAKK